MLSGKQQQREAELPREKCLQASAASVPFKPPTAACWDMEHQRQRVSPVRIFNFPSPPFDVLFPLPPKFNPQERPLPLSSPIAPSFPCQSHCKPQSNKPGGWREMQNSVRIQKKSKHYQATALRHHCHHQQALQPTSSFWDAPSVAVPSSLPVQHSHKSTALFQNLTSNPPWTPSQLPKGWPVGAVVMPLAVVWL